MSRKSLDSYSKKTRSNALKRLKIELAELSYAPMPEFEASPVSEVNMLLSKSTQIEIKGRFLRMERLYPRPCEFSV